MTDHKKPKLATELPAPPKLTPQDFERLDQQAMEWRAAVDAGTQGLERLTDRDLRIRLR